MNRIDEVKTETDYLDCLKFSLSILPKEKWSMFLYWSWNQLITEYEEYIIWRDMEVIVPWICEAINYWWFKGESSFSAFSLMQLSWNKYTDMVYLKEQEKYIIKLQGFLEFSHYFIEISTKKLFTLKLSSYLQRRICRSLKKIIRLYEEEYWEFYSKLSIIELNNIFKNIIV